MTFKMNWWMDLRFSWVSGFVFFLLVYQLFYLSVFDSFYNEDYYFNRERVTELEKVSEELLASGRGGRFFLDGGYKVLEKLDGDIDRRVFQLMKSFRIRSCNVEHGCVTWGWYNSGMRRWFEYRYTPHPEKTTLDSRKWNPAFGANWHKCVW